jgi:hypothetical protein
MSRPVKLTVSAEFENECGLDDMLSVCQDDESVTELGVGISSESMISLLPSISSDESYKQSRAASQKAYRQRVKDRAVEHRQLQATVIGASPGSIDVNALSGTVLSNVVSKNLPTIIKKKVVVRYRRLIVSVLRLG